MMIQLSNDAQAGKKQEKGHRFRSWLHSASFRCGLLFFGAFLLLMVLFFLVCAPRKYDLSVGSISHVTVDATKDVIDEVTTEEKRAAAEAAVEPTYRFQQGVKEDVLSSLEDTFGELRTIQQYGQTLKNDDSIHNYYRSFSEEEIDYALSLVNSLSLSRTQITTLLRVDTAAFDDMVKYVMEAVTNALNATIREGQVSQAILNIQQIVGYKVDVSLMQTILPAVLRTCVKPNMIIDQDAMADSVQKAREAVEPVMVLTGQNVVREGDRITQNQLEVLRSLGLLNDRHYDYSVYGGAVINIAIAMVSLIMLLRLLLKQFLTRPRPLLVILLILILCLSFAAVSNLLPSLYIIPIALGAILGTVLLGYRAGLCLTFPLALLFAGLTSCSTKTTSYDAVVIMANTLSSGVATIWFLKGRPQRLRVLLAGLISAVFSILMIVGIKLLTSAEALDILNNGTWALAGGLLSGALAVALQPAFEAIFHLATPSRLLEITNPNHPLMKRLMIEAPGTYHHSIIVANLAEAAADKIGANPFLARAGAYYHDIGKLKRPGYFSENQHGSNPHANTDPYVSAAILTAHTKDGYLLAQKEHLPPEVQDIILQHHGVTPVMFFYHKALQLAGGKHVDINDFRYAGPKPQTKEASIVMLADTIEAAVRSMKDPNPKAIDQFIERLVRGKVEDGQLTDCALSLRDIDQICDAFSGILKGVYHERVEYPKVSPLAAGGQNAAPAAGETPVPSPDGQDGKAVPPVPADGVQEQSAGETVPAGEAKSEDEKTVPDRPEEAAGADDVPANPEEVVGADDAPAGPEAGTDGEPAPEQETPEQHDED